VGESEGRSVLDAAEAATQLPGATVGDRYAIIGYSQGGHAALWANELAETWGPDLDLVGVVAGAPVTELPASFTSRPEATGFFMSMVAGYEAAYPDADPARLLTGAGLAALDLVDQGCTGEVFDAVAARSREEPLRRPGDMPEEWVALLAANDPGQVAADSPVLILHSLTDELLPATTSEQLHERMCDAGQVVERRTYDQGQTHITAASTAFTDGLAWINERMTTTTAPLSTCP
jgi:pimeloyl-ACP methyl ester carboxylesterase